MADKALLMEAVRRTDLDPKARLSMVRESGSVLYEYVGGSHAYGTSLPTSDRDVRGVFCLPASEYLSTTKPADGMQDDRKTDGKKRNDDFFFTLRRFFELLKGANPNVIEALWMPEDFVVSASPEIRLVIARRELFVSKACLGSHFGYAKDQIAKARGKNKKVNNAGFYEPGMNKLVSLLKAGEVTNEWVKSRFGEAILNEALRRMEVSGVRQGA